MVGRIGKSQRLIARVVMICQIYRYVTIRYMLFAFHAQDPFCRLFPRHSRVALHTGIFCIYPIHPRRSDHADERSDHH